MVTKTKKDFSVAFLLQDNNNNNNNDYSSKSNSFSMTNNTKITPSEYWLTGKFNFGNFIIKIKF
jgi:hypothetical protein